jgi:carboxyl-terminal processing protease
MRTEGIRSAFAVACLAAAAGCGGGGGGASAGGGGNGPPANPTYTAGVYQAPSTYAAYCAVPRTGTDPYNNGAPYPDRPGSVVWENSWIRSWINAYYLWYGELPDLDPASYGTTSAYFDADKTPALTASGTPKDHFHFTYPTAQWEALSQSGVSVGYGVTFVLIAVTPPRQALVAYTEPASSGYPATSAAVQLARGASIVAVDGVDLINSTGTASVNALNAGLFPSQAGETHSFTVVDTPGAASRTVTMTAVSITETPVPSVQTLATASGAVGYLLFNDHIATAESELVTAVNTLAAAGINDLVLDIRYNGGGYLDIASELAYMIAGPALTTGRTFDLVTFNGKYPTTDPITGRAITPTPFWSQTQGFSVAAGQALPSLNLSRVFVLTGTDTCSASEAILNSLRGVGVQVILIGSQTCGKPYGFYPQDNCGTTYFSIEFKGVNQIGFGDYSDGFVAQNTTSTSGVQIPGCSVADDYAHALGDPAESRLAAALAYRANGSAGCPAPPSGFGPPSGPLSVDGHVAKPEWLRNRILRRPH